MVISFISSVISKNWNYVLWCIKLCYKYNANFIAGTQLGKLSIKQNSTGFNIIAVIIEEMSHDQIPELLGDGQKIGW